MVEADESRVIKERPPVERCLASPFAEATEDKCEAVGEQGHTRMLNPQRSTLYVAVCLFHTQ
jgi:hypothetical protein